MQNNAMFRIICLRIGHALLKFRFTASGLVFRGGLRQCVLIKTGVLSYSTDREADSEDL